MSLTHKLVQKMTDKNIFLRGEEYYRAGMVRSLVWDGKYIRSEVHGSRRKPYKVTTTFSRGNPTVNCTCPHHLGGLCKHGVAVLLYLIDHGETGVSDDDEDDLESEVDGRYNGDGKSGADTSFKDFLISTSDAPRLRLVLNVKTLLALASKSVAIGLVVSFRGQEHKIVDIEGLLTASRHVLNEHLPSLTVFSPGQLHLLNIMRGFYREMGAEQGKLLKVRSFQMSVLVDHISRLNDVDVIDAKSQSVCKIIQEPPVGLRVTVRSILNDQIAVTATLVDSLRADRKFNLDDILLGNRLWFFDAEDMSFRVLHSQIDYRFLGYFLDKERTLDSVERSHFLAGILGQLKSFAEVIVDSDLVSELAVVNLPVKPCYKIDVERGELSLALLFDYSGEKLAYRGVSDELYIERAVDSKSVLVRRDMARESEVVQELLSNYHFNWDERASCFLISTPDEMFEFLSQRVQGLAASGEVFLSERARAIFREDDDIRPFVRVTSSGIDWFAYDVAYSRGGQVIDIPDNIMREQFAAGRKFIQLKTGEFVKLDAGSFERVSGLLDDRERKGRLMLAHIPFIMDELQASGVGFTVDAETKKLYDELKGFKGIEEVSIPASMEGVLRDYQRYGVSWLAFLKQFRFGGILADEMGLGKTLQALTMIKRDIEAGCALPSLIVCPTTLVWNWQAEIRKFFPDLTALVVSGKDRRLGLEDIPAASIVITSYSLLRRDIEQYHKHQFHYLVLDEAQNIKNRHTISARVTKQLHADYRVALTGTPLENSIADIWSIFDFLMPSFLGSYERFRITYEVPITQEQSQEKLQELSKRIMPFVLRRIKHDVIKELPDKIEQISFCELEPAQAKIYAAMADKARAEVVDAYRKKGFQRSRMLILTLILRLRQICCHPELAGVGLKHRIGISAKTDLLKEMLQELLPSGHRVLIFSQFVGMLGIMRDYLIREGIPYEYMDGQTKDRAKRVEHFNSDPAVKVFLLSLKVGGLGLNLTSADTVILYEPWWNPSVEQQAIDRAHRIGQHNAVLAYHLIARGTIEEKILELQSRKKFLMSALVLSDSSMSKKLGWEDIKFLLDLKSEV